MLISNNVYCLSEFRLDEEELSDYDEEDEIGLYRQGATLMRTGEAGARTKRPKGYYPIYVSQDLKAISTLQMNADDFEVYPKTQDGTEMSWRRSPKKLIAELTEIIIKKTGNGISFYKKQRLELGDSLRGKKPKSLFYKPEYSSGNGTYQIKQLFGSKVFDNPKPLDLIQDIVEIGTKRDKQHIVLDFFGGSGVTGQAVMELNEADSGNRKFILVQLPELTDEKSEAYKAGYKRISDITIERNKRVVNRIIEEKKAEHPNLFENPDDHESIKGLGFKVFKLETSYFPRTEWTPNPEADEAENVQSLKDYIAAKESQLRIDFDRDKLLTEILLKEGFKLNYSAEPFADITTNKVERISDGEKEALICLDNTIETETTDYFKTHKDLKFICLERGLDTTKKWNLANSLGEKFKAV